MVEKQYETLKLRGSLRIALMAGGEVLHERTIDNLVVLAGRSWALGQLESTNHVTSQNISYIAIGSSTVAPNATDTALGLEVTRVAISSFDTTLMTANPPSWASQCVYATNQANTTLAEIGLFNSSAVGTMFSHATFASFVKATSNTLNVTYTVQD